MAMLSLWQQEQEGSGTGVVEDQPGKKEKKRGKGALTLLLHRHHAANFAVLALPSGLKLLHSS